MKDYSYIQGSDYIAPTPKQAGTGEQFINGLLGVAGKFGQSVTDQDRQDIAAQQGSGKVFEAIKKFKEFLTAPDPETVMKRQRELLEQDKIKAGTESERAKVIETLTGVKNKNDMAPFERNKVQSEINNNDATAAKTKAQIEAESKRNPLEEEEIKARTKETKNKATGANIDNLLKIPTALSKIFNGKGSADGSGSAGKASSADLKRLEGLDDALLKMEQDALKEKTNEFSGEVIPVDQEKAFKDLQTNPAFKNLLARRNRLAEKIGDSPYYGEAEGAGADTGATAEKPDPNKADMDVINNHIAKGSNDPVPTNFSGDGSGRVLGEKFLKQKSPVGKATSELFSNIGAAVDSAASGAGKMVDFAGQFARGNIAAAQNINDETFFNKDVPSDYRQAIKNVFENDDKETIKNLIVKHFDTNTGLHSYLSLEGLMKMADRYYGKTDGAQFLGKEPGKNLDRFFREFFPEKF